MKKNIRIVTWIGGGNYGTSLQSFSLHRKLEDLGYKTNIVLPCIPTQYSLKSIIVCLLILAGIDTKKVKRIIKGDYRTTKQLRLDKFEEKHYKRIYICFPFQLSRLNKNTNVYVTGSDQIWNTVYRFDRFYFLDFAFKVKRIAYASSMGVVDFPEEHKREVKELLSNFYKIGVREETAAQAISKLLNRNDICQVLDPTFLLNQEEWATLSEDAEIEVQLPPRYIFCYFIGNNLWYREQVEIVKKETGINHIVQVCLNEDECVILSDALNYKDAGPLEFVKLIKDATFICTDSFHATAVSINLEKDFVEFMRFHDTEESSQNSRIYDILSHYGLSSRIYSNDNIEWAVSIDYTSVTKQLELDRKRSIEFLVNAIEQ